ncbi:uncharacterized protein JCM6883_005809 [Sporobolomyces salmoneus]|uniref:uncharacterized protein n=1 Tax=Sporobolomyces salmoneus TaxID=183962 RepID=UPI00317A217C
MFDSPLPTSSLSPSPRSSATTSLDPPRARYQSTSPSFQLVPLPEETPSVNPFPFGNSSVGSQALSPTSPSGSRALPIPIDPNSSLYRHRASISSDNSSSKGSPASPLLNLPSTSASTSTWPDTKPSTAPTKTPFVPPPPPPPLSNPLDLLERSRTGLSQLIGFGNIDARPSRQTNTTGAASLKSGACTACRTAKAKCSQRQPACERCVSLKIECVYAVFAKRGRKRSMTPNQVLLENCHRDIEQALAILSSSSPPHSVPPPLPPINASPDVTHPVHSLGLTTEEEESGSTKELKDVLENPLALLAHISSLKVGGDSTTDEESGKHFLPQQITSRDTEPTVEGYFATGLYQLRSDADPAYDPVSLGIINEHTLARYVDFYFSSLHPFIFHLTPSIHTPRFLRDTSPFLTTALACICATFDPSSQSTVPALFNHLQLINTRIWSEGLKSLEIVQAYMLLIHWTPIANNWGDDRRWGWLGTAIRIATEIKLHKTLNQTTYDFYRSVTPLSDDAFQRLSDDRIRSWRLISVAETALGVSTGRLGAISNLCSVWPGPLTPSNLTRDHPHYNIYAILELTKIYANGICLSNNVTDSEASTNFDIRASFKSKLMHDLSNWRQTWTHANHFVRMIYSHNLTILLSISLRFRGPVAPVLEECRVQAHETASLAVNWPDDSYKWGSNISVVVVAYAATLLLRIDATKPGPLSPAVIHPCSAVADKLLQTGAVRPETRTLATLHGTRIRTLLAASTSPSAPQPLPSSLLPSDLTSQPSLSDPNIHATFDSLSSSSKEVQLFPPTFPGLEPSLAPAPPSHSFSPISPPPHSHAHDPSTNGISLKPDSDHLWSLPSSESHMLWDLFHDHRPQSAVSLGAGGGGLAGVARSTTSSTNPLSPSQLLVASRPSSSGGLPPSGTGSAGESGDGGDGEKKEKKNGTRSNDGNETMSTTTPGGGEDWVHRNALETDWLNSEPGAWAW